MKTNGEESESDESENEFDPGLEKKLREGEIDDQQKDISRELINCIIALI